MSEGVTRPDSWDPLMGETRPDTYWTTSNVGEAIPGVLTPLTWSLWGPSIEHAPRESGYLIGAITRAEAEVPERGEDRYLQIFYGRPAMSIDWLALVGDRLPGTTGPDAVRSVIGRVPEDLEFRPTKSRYPAVAWRLPLTFAKVPRELAALSRDFDAWWKASVESLPRLDQRAAQALFAEAVRRHDQAMVAQTNSILSNIQPVYEAVAGLVDKAGAGDVSILTGASGGAEMAVVRDIWRASRGEIGVEAVVRNHGFHGPGEGELSSRVWREDDAPLRKMVEQYATRDASADPRRREEERNRNHKRTEFELLHALPAAQKPGARLVLKFARERLPLRGVAKRAFLQANDVARASARRMGEELAQQGALAEPEDVFYLTVEELTAAEFSADAKELVTRRRARRAEYERVELPETWKGNPVPIPIEEAEAAKDAAAGAETTSAGDVISGVGVSAGVVEGVVRVVSDPSFADVEPDEVLVAPTTDPSWSSIMFISSALVVDIGGPISHAAVVAREMDIPCVVNTQDGTRRLRTGDRVRVDGGAGTVEILERP